MNEQKISKLNNLGNAQDSNQVVEVQFPNGGKNYSYIGSGNLRTGQQVKNAPVNHYKSGKPYTAPVTVVATHNIAGAKIGDKLGVENGNVKSISTGLKYLPGAKEGSNQIDINGEKMTVNDYMQPFKQDKMQRLNTFGVVGR